MRIFLLFYIFGFVCLKISCEDIRYSKIHGTEIIHKENQGLYIMDIGAHLKENLIDVLGYLMYQPTTNIGKKLFLHLDELKYAIQLNDVDVFQIIPALPKIVKMDLKNQFFSLLEHIYGIRSPRDCTERCVFPINEIKETIDLNYIMGHLSYSPLFTGIIDVHGKSLTHLNEAAIKILESKYTFYEKETEALSIFSPVVVHILRDIYNNSMCLSEKFLGYLLRFYPWTFHDKNLDVALGQLIGKLTDNKEDLVHCKIMLNDLHLLALKPVALLEMALERILESFCPLVLKKPAKIIKNALQKKITNYQNLFKGDYVEAIQLQTLLDIIDHRGYPVEIVLARERVMDYLNKILPYIEYQSFPTYYYHTSEERLQAFLNFILLKTPHANLIIKASINAIRTYLMFAKGPQTISLDLMISLTDAWLAPDLNDEIREEMLETKIFLLDEGTNIRRILERQAEKRCYDVLSCFIAAVGMLKSDESFASKIQYLELPQCILNRFFKGQYILSGRTARVNLKNLLDVITFHQYTREMVMAANRIKEFISNGKDILPEFNNDGFCTKQESLLSYLEQATKNPNYPRSVYDSMKAIIPNISLRVRAIGVMNVRVMDFIMRAFHAPDSDEAIAQAMAKIDNFMGANEGLLESHLEGFEANRCFDVLGCYNDMAEFLNKLNLGYKFQFFRPFSPELYVLNLGFNANDMSVERIIRIVKSLAAYQTEEHNELEAAILYALQTKEIVNPYIQKINCTDKQVMPCFEQILSALRVNQHKLKVKVNVYQYILTPATCDRRYCQWINYNERGSVILNPLLEYIKDLLENIAQNIQNLHLQMDAMIVLDFLKSEKVDVALDAFRIRQHMSDTEKVVGFLTLLLKESYIDENYILSMQNLVDYLSMGRKPQYFTLYNLKSLVKLLGTMTTANVLCEMETKLLRLISEKEKVIKFLKTLSVDCTEFDRCLLSLDDQLTQKIDTIYAPLVLQVIKPEICAIVKCPWTTKKFKAVNSKYLDLKELIFRIIQELQLKPLPLVVKLLLESLIKEDRLSYFIHFLAPDEVDKILNPSNKNPLTDFVDVLEKNNLISAELKPSIRQLHSFLKEKLIPDHLNHETLINMLREMSAVTRDDYVRTEISAVQALIHDYMSQINAGLIKFTVDCIDVLSCARNLFEKIQKVDLGNEKVTNLLNAVLLAPTCSKAHCPYKISVSKREIDGFLQTVLDKLDYLKDNQNVSYHISMDIDFVKKFLRAKGIDIFTWDLVYHSSDPKITLSVLQNILSQDRQLPRDLSLCVSNILSYFNDNLSPTYIQLPHLIHIASKLQQSVNDPKLQSKFDQIMQNIEMHATDINRMLLDTPLNCSTFKSCIESLYLRLIGDPNNPTNKIVLEMITPSGCDDSTCPWLQEFVSKQLHKTRVDTFNEIGSYIDRNIPLQLKLDFGSLQDMLKYEGLDGLFGNLDTATLPTFLESIGTNLLHSYDVDDSVKNIIGYLTTDKVPNKLEFSTLKRLAYILMNSTEDNIVKKDMIRAVETLALECYAENVKQLLTKFIVNCTEMQNCLTSIYENIQAHRNHPMSVLIENLLFPQSCDKKNCPWLIKESTRGQLRKLQTIKTQMTQMVDSNSHPFLVTLKLDALKGCLNVENSKNALTKVSGKILKKPEGLTKFLEELLTSEQISVSPEMEDHLSSVLSYLKTGQTPKLSIYDLPGLVKSIAIEVDDASVQQDLFNLQAKVERYEPIIKDTLNKCDISSGCDTLNSCVKNLQDCLIRSSSLYSKVILDILSQIDCPACRSITVAEEYAKEEHLFPLPKPFNANQIIFFVQTPGGLQSVSLDLDDKEVVEKLLELPKPDTSTTQIASFEVKDGNDNLRKIALDLNDKLTIDRVLDLSINPTEPPVIDFSSMNSAIIYVPMENGVLRPLKLDLSRPNVRQTLKQLAKYQINTGNNPEITFVDLDGARHTLAIDVNNNALWTSLLKCSSDLVYTDIPTLMLYPGHMNDSWRSMLVTDKDKHAIKTLQNLPTFEKLNQANPVLQTTGGMLQMSFNVYDRIVSSILNNLNSEVPVVHVDTHKNILLTVPDKFGHLMPIKTDLTDQKNINALSRVSQQLGCTTCRPTFTFRTETDLVPIHLNFDSPLNIITFAEGMRRVEQPINLSTVRKVIALKSPFDKKPIVLLPEDQRVIDALTELTTVGNKRGKLVNLEDGNNQIQVTIDLNNPLVMEFLKNLMSKTLAPFPPTLVACQEGSKHIVMAMENPQGTVVPMIFEENQKNLDILSNVSQPFNPKAVEAQLDQNLGIKIDLSDRNTLMALQVVDGGDMKGIATEFKDATTDIEDAIEIPITDNGKTKLVLFQTRKPHVYDTLKDTCADTSENSTAIIAYRPTDGQQEVFYCDLQNPQTGERLKRYADRIKEKLDSELTAIVSLPDKTGHLHSFIFDLRNQDVLDTMRYYTKTANPNSENKIAMSFKNQNGRHEIFTLDLNQISIDDIKSLASKTTPSMVPIQTVIDGKKFLVTTYAETDNSTGFLILNLTDSKTQELLTEMSEPGNVLATKIPIEESNGKIDLFVDFDSKKNFDIIRDLSQNPPAIPVPIILKKPAGIFTVEVNDELGNPIVTYLNVTDDKIAHSLETNSNAPKLTVVTPDNKLRVIHVDAEGDLTKYGETYHKPSKHSLTVITPENGKPILLDLATREIVEGLLSLHSVQPTKHSIIVRDNDGRDRVVNLDLQSEMVAETLKQLEGKNPPNILPTTIPTFEENHNFIAFTITLDEKNSKSVLIDNKDFNTIRKLIELSDKANPQAKSFIVSDGNGMNLPLHLDLADSKVKQVLVEAGQNNTAQTGILMNSGDKIYKYIEVPLESTNDMLKCDITSPSVLKQLQSITNKNLDKIGTTFSIVEPHTRRMISLVLNLNDAYTNNVLRQLCPETVVHPESDKICVVVTNDNGTAKPTILDLGDDRVREMLTKINQDNPRGNHLIQFVDDNGVLNVFKIDFGDAKTLHEFKVLEETNSKVYAPTLVTSSDGSKAVVFNVMDQGKMASIVLNVDDQKVLNLLHTLSASENINATVITFQDSNGKTYQFFLDLSSQEVVNALKRASKDLAADKPFLVTPVLQSGDLASIAVIDEDGQIKILNFNLTPETIQQLHEASSSENKKPSILINVPEGNTTRMIRIEYGNDKITNHLEGFSSSHELIPNPGNLVLIPMRANGASIILDLTDDTVLKTLKDISATTPRRESTSMFIITDNDQRPELIKLNLEDAKVQKILFSLAQQTPENIRPIEFITPNKDVVLAFTTKGKTRPYLLNVSDDGVVNILKSLPPNPNPINPLVLDFHDKQGTPIRIVLDKADSNTMQALDQAQSMTHLLTEPIKNQPYSKLKEEKLILPVEQENGNQLSYSFDISNADVVRQLISMSSVDFTKPALVVYLTDEMGRTIPVRLNIYNEDVLSSLQSFAEDVSAQYTSKTALVFVLENEGRKEVIILDKDSEEVVETLKYELGHHFPATYKNTSIINLVDSDGYVFELKLDLTSKMVNDTLKTLQTKTTPKVIRPFLVKSSHGVLPLVVFAIKDKFNNSITVALDQNKPQVVNALKELAVPKKIKTVTIPLYGLTGEIEEINLDVEQEAVIEALVELTQLTPTEETAIMVPASTLVLNIIDDNSNMVKIQLDTRDENVLQTLIEISKTVSPNTAHCVGLVQDKFGNTIPIKLNLINPETVTSLLMLSRRFIYPKQHRIIPSSGYIPLQVFDIPLGTFNFPITIDCNNASVIQKIQQQSQKLRPGVIPVKIMACENQGITLPILVDLEDQNLPLFLTGVSVLSPVIINPEVVFPEGGKLPLIFMLIEQDFGQASVSLDLNDASTVDALLPLQPQVKDGVTTFYYFDRNKKVPLFLDLKNQTTVDALRKLSAAARIRLIPIIYRQPILEIVAENETFKLDLNNIVVKRAMEEIAKYIPSRSENPQIYLEIPTKFNLPTPIYINVTNEEVVFKFRELTALSPPPKVMVIPHRQHKVQQASVTIMAPSASNPYALFHIRDFGPVCLDINNEMVRNQLMMLINGPEPKVSTYVMIPNINGDIFVLKLDLHDYQTLGILKSLTITCGMYYEPTEASANTVSIKLTRKIVNLDLNRADVIEALKNLSKSHPEPKTYSIYIPGKPTFVAFHIDVQAQHTQDILYQIEKPKLPPFLFTFKYQDLDMSVWKLVLDINNDDAMTKLMEFSVRTTRDVNLNPNVIILRLLSPQGRQLEAKLDKTNPKTLQLLKDLTVECTGTQPELLIKPKPKSIQTIPIKDKLGHPVTVSIDVNNLSVLKKLQLIIESQGDGPKTAIELPMPDGTTRLVHLDINDLATIENLIKLSMESERGIPAKLIKIKTHKTIIPILMSFTLNAPFVGLFTVTIDVAKQFIVDQLKILAAEFIPGRSESQVQLRDVKGNEFLLKIDLTNSTTVYKLVMMTIESTGHNPTNFEPKEILNHVTYVPDILTIEVPDGFEVVPVSIDKSYAAVIGILRQLHNPATSVGTSLELVENGVPFNVLIDTTSQVTLAALRSVGLQTIIPKVLLYKIQLFTLIFVPVSSGYAPIFLDLSKKETVITILYLAKTTVHTKFDTYLEVRDDYGQYITIGLDLTNSKVIQNLLAMSPPLGFYAIDGTNLPYLTLCLPDLTGHRCVKIKLKTSAIDELQKLPFASHPVKLQILDGLQRTTDVLVDPTYPGLIQLLISFDNAALILSPLTLNIFVIYSGESEEVTPIYVDLSVPKTFQLLYDLEMTYTSTSPMAVVRYMAYKNTVSYLTFALDEVLLAQLMDVSAVVSGHTIVKQNVTQRTTIMIPTKDDASFPIVLDMADKDIVQGLKDLSNAFDPKATPTLINMEDAQGYPFQIKIDIYNQATIGRLIELSNKERIV